jgi:hypothetical protein
MTEIARCRRPPLLLSYSQNLVWSSVYVLHEIVGNLSDQLVEIVLSTRDKRSDVDHRRTPGPSLA